MKEPNSKAPSSAPRRPGDGGTLDLDAYRDRLMSAVAREEAGRRTDCILSPDALAFIGDPLMDAMRDQRSKSSALQSLPHDEPDEEPAFLDSLMEFEEALRSVTQEVESETRMPTPSTTSLFSECDATLRTLAALSYDPEATARSEDDRQPPGAPRNRMENATQIGGGLNILPQTDHGGSDIYLAELWDTIMEESEDDVSNLDVSREHAHSKLIDAALTSLRNGETCKDTGRAIGANPNDVYTWMWDALLDGRLSGYEPVPLSRTSAFKRQNGTRIRKLPAELEFDTESEWYRQETKQYRSLVANRSSRRIGLAGGFHPMRGTHPRPYGVGQKNGSTSRHPGSDEWNVAEFIGPTIPAWIYGTSESSYTPETKLAALSMLRSGASHLQVSKAPHMKGVSIGAIYAWDKKAIAFGLLSPPGAVGEPRLPSTYIGPVRPLPDFLPDFGKSMSTQNTPQTEQDSAETRATGEPEGILSHWRPDSFSDGPERRLEFRIGEASRPSLAVTFSASPSVEILAALQTVIKQNILQEPKDQMPILACSDDTIVPPILAAMNRLAAETERTIEIRSPSQTIELRD